MEQPLVVLCPAKVNLYLRVLGRRPDGYHDLDSVFQAVNLCDQLELRPSEELTLTCNVPHVPTGLGNLALRAALLLRERFAITRGAELVLDKQIPTQAGLGGGSSDAAGALLGLCRLWDAQPDATELLELAAQLGSDVSFFLVGGAARIAGRGEVVTSLPPAHQHHLVLVKPSFGISTADAYEQLDRAVPAYAPRPLDAELIGRATTQELARCLHNDFERALLPIYPELAEIKQDLLNAGCSGSLLCGSGSAVFGLARDGRHAQAVAEQMGERWPWARAVTTWPYGATFPDDGN